MTNIKKIKDSIILLCCGVIYLSYNTLYPIDQLNNPGPGIFPFTIGSLLIILVIFQLVKTLKGPTEKSNNVKSLFHFKSLIRLLYGEQKSNTLFLGITMGLYILMIKWIGFYVSTFFFVIFSSRLMGAKDLSKPVVLALGINFFCYLLFNVILKLSFPKGFLF